MQMTTNRRRVKFLDPSIKVTESVPVNRQGTVGRAIHGRFHVQASPGDLQSPSDPQAPEEGERRVSDKPEVYYYPTPEQAEQVRNRIKHRHPESRVVEYQKGHAIQYHVSGPYYPELEEPRAIDRAVYRILKRVSRIQGQAIRADVQEAADTVNSTLVDVADRVNRAFIDLTGILGADLKEARAIGRAKGILELALMDLGLFAVMPPAPIPDNLESSEPT